MLHNKQPSGVIVFLSFTGRNENDKSMFTTMNHSNTALANKNSNAYFNTARSTK